MKAYTLTAHFFQVLEKHFLVGKKCFAMLNSFLWAILERPIRQSGSSDEKGARIQGEPNSLGKKIANF